MMSEKEQFIRQLKKRTKKLAVDIINFCNSLKKADELNRLITESNDITINVKSKRHNIQKQLMKYVIFNQSYTI